MQVREAMCSGPVRLASPEETLSHAAQAMAENDCGVLPVAEDDRLVGIITDRDIALRGVAFGRGPDSHVRDVMSSDVKYCFEDETLEDVAQHMADLQVRRMPVLSRQKRLVGMVSLGDLAKAEAQLSGAALKGVARKSEQHNQGAIASQWEHRGGAHGAV